MLQGQSQTMSIGLGQNIQVDNKTRFAVDKNAKDKLTSYYKEEYQKATQGLDAAKKKHFNVEMFTAFMTVVVIISTLFLINNVFMRNAPDSEKAACSGNAMLIIIFVTICVFTGIHEWFPEGEFAWQSMLMGDNVHYLNREKESLTASKSAIEYEYMNGYGEVIKANIPVNKIRNIEYDLSSGRITLEGVTDIETRDAYNKFIPFKCYMTSQDNNLFDYFEPSFIRWIEDNIPIHVSYKN